MGWGEPPPPWCWGTPHCAPASPQGYEGLVEGGDNIKQANWLSVSNIIQLVRLNHGTPKSHPLPKPA